ncbi:cytochrome P450 [Pseudonocardia humida]|uniref:Cytochrome P450 n=1 Tax=Pseudonocardia humida TaxID=2800819 RepID=A0ABT1ADH8_9PSEU|nr:cytochrome P450 [Pseudonocardia humida]MCO1661001.1 cytochrome P450 [Pseudonocardia humida]
MEGARRALRWGLRHGIFRQVIRRRIGGGDETARFLLDPSMSVDPYLYYDDVRTRGRLVDNGMVLNTCHHDVATAVLRSQDFGVAGPPEDEDLPAPLRLAARVAGRGPLGPGEPPSMLTTNPPDHTRYRKLVTRGFSARVVATLRSRTEQVAAELLDEMAGRGTSADLVRDYAALLPATVIAEMLGAPAEMRGQFLEWGAGAALSLDAGLTYRDFVRSEKDITALQEWMAGHFARLRRSPGEDTTILSALLSARDGDGRLSEDELLSIAMLLLAAGFETTVNLIGNGAALLTSHPDQLAVLTAEPQRWPTAVDEMLRIDSPVQRTGRMATRDTEVAGERVRAGQFVVIMLGGANRDPAVFPEPARFDVTRANAGEHLAFSSGIHYCLGAGLARMEGEVALRALFERFPDLAPAGPPHRRPTRTLRGWDAMPVTLQPSTVDA